MKLTATLSLKWVATALLVFAFWATPNQANLATRPTSMTPAKTALLQFEDHIKDMYNQMGLEQMGLSYNVFKYAVSGYYNIDAEKRFAPGRTKLAICDFRQPSNKKRLYVVDLATKQVIFNTYVAHGKNSGLVYAQYFSNSPETLQSSLGFYITEEVYYGSNGYSLRMNGLDRGFNDRAKERGIVLHGAPYVGESFITQSGRAGRSWGCPAVPLELSHEIIDAMRWGNCLFVYSDDTNYLNSSRFVNVQKAATAFALSNNVNIN